MVTRRAVLKGTAAASIGAIAAAHGATPVAAEGCGYGNFEGGAGGSFYKYRDAFQVALKFHKFAADIFIKEELGGGVTIFSKFFQKEWVEGEPQTLSDSFPNLTDASLSFQKFDTSSAAFFLKYGDKHMVGTIDVSTDQLLYEFQEINNEID